MPLKVSTAESGITSQGSTEKPSVTQRLYTWCMQPLPSSATKTGFNIYTNVAMPDRNGEEHVANRENVANGRPDRFSLKNDTLRHMFFEGAALSGMDSEAFAPFRQEVQDEIIPPIAAIFGLLSHKKIQLPSLPQEIKSHIADFLVDAKNPATHTVEKDGVRKEGLLPTKEELGRQGFVSLYGMVAYDAAFKAYRKDISLKDRLELDAMPDANKETAKKEWMGTLQEQLKTNDPRNNFISALDESHASHIMFGRSRKRGLNLESTTDIANSFAERSLAKKPETSEKVVAR